MVSHDSKNPKNVYNTKPKDITTSVIPVFLYLVPFNKNSPKRKANRSPTINGTGTKKSITKVYSSLRILQFACVAFCRLSMLYPRDSTWSTSFE